MRISHGLAIVAFCLLIVAVASLVTTTMLAISIKDLDARIEVLESEINP